MQEYDSRETIRDFFCRLLRIYGRSSNTFEDVPPTSSEADAAFIVDVKVCSNGHIDVVCANKPSASQFVQDASATESEAATSSKTDSGKSRDGVHCTSSKISKRAADSVSQWSVRVVAAIAHAVARRRNKSKSELDKDDEDIFGHILFESPVFEEDDLEDIEEFAKAKALLAAFLEQEEKAFAEKTTTADTNASSQDESYASKGQMSLLKTSFNHSEETLIGCDDSIDTDVTAVSSPVEPKRAFAPEIAAEATLAGTSKAPEATPLTCTDERRHSSSLQQKLEALVTAAALPAASTSSLSPTPEKCISTLYDSEPTATSSSSIAI